MRCSFSSASAWREPAPRGGSLGDVVTGTAADQQQYQKFLGIDPETSLKRDPVPPSKLAPGQYRTVTGNFAVALGMAVTARLSGNQVFLGSYPITPATEILQESSYYKDMGVVTYQAEDEIAALNLAIGASYAGARAACGVARTPSPARPGTAEPAVHGALGATCSV